MTDPSDTWAPGWEQRLSDGFQAAGSADAWGYIKTRPGVSYLELAERLSREAGVEVAPVQLEALQVRDTPEHELALSARDSLARLLRGAFPRLGWGQGEYWRGKAGGALASWTTMWASRLDVAALPARLVEATPPVGWVPLDGDDGILRGLLPE